MKGLKAEEGDKNETERVGKGRVCAVNKAQRELREVLNHSEVS